MYERTRRALAALLAALLLTGLWPALPAARAEADGMLRVKLTRLGAPSSVTLYADCPLTPSVKGASAIPAGTEVTVTASQGALVLEAGGKRADAGASLLLARGETGGRGVQFASPSLSNKFCGDLLLTASGGVISAVLNIYVEEYLYGLVGYEMALSAGPAALEAQAVAARSYALSQKAAGVGEYDLTDTAGGFTYKGLSDGRDYARAIRAVDDTRGQVLWYNGALACGWCTESNGGQTESAANAFGTAAAYTAVMDDAYDLESNAGRKAVTLSKDASGLPEALGKLLSGGADRALTQAAGEKIEGARILAIEAVTPVQPRFAAPSRLYTALRFSVRAEGVNAKGNAIAATATVNVPTYGGLERWYDLSLNDEDNETVWVEETGEGFVVTFRRSGHGVGLSQKGAQCMAGEHGMGMADILSYYYPGAKLKTLSLSEQATAQPRQAKKASRAAIAEARLKDRADLLEKPVKGGTTVTVLPAGATVEIYAARGQWAAVGSGGNLGYVRLTALTGCVLAGADVERPDPPDALVLPTAQTLLALPAKDAPAVAKLSAGDVIDITARTDQWLEVAVLSGPTGFLPASAQNAPDETAPSTDSEGGRFHKVKGRRKRFVYVSEEGLTLYGSYSESSSPLTALEKDQKLRLLGYNEKWACVSTDTQRGFVLRSGVTATKPGGEASEPGATQKPMSGAKRVKGKKTVTIRGSMTVLYESWDTASRQLAWLEKGDEVRLLAYTDEWAYVDAGAQKGYVQMSAITGRDGETAFDAVTLVEQKLYADATLTGSALATVPKGAVVRVLGYEGQVVYVEYNSQKGYLPVAYLQRK